MVRDMLACMMVLSGYLTSTRIVGMCMEIKQNVDKIRNFIDMKDKFKYRNLFIM